MNHQSSIFAVSVYNHESQSLFSSWPFSPFFPNDLPILGPFPPVKAQKKNHPWPHFGWPTHEGLGCHRRAYRPCAKCALGQTDQRWWNGKVAGRTWCFCPCLRHSLAGESSQLEAIFYCHCCDCKWQICTNLGRAQKKKLWWPMSIYMIATKNDHHARIWSHPSR